MLILSMSVFYVLYKPTPNPQPTLFCLPFLIHHFFPYPISSMDWWCAGSQEWTIPVSLKETGINSSWPTVCLHHNLHYIPGFIPVSLTTIVFLLDTMSYVVVK